MIRIDENKQALELLKTLAYCGDYPVQAVDLISCESRDYLLKVIRQMREDRYISKTGSREIESLRILKKGMRVLSDISPRAVEQYMIATDGRVFSGQYLRKIRELRISESVQLMRLAAVNTAVWEKPQLSEIHRQTPVQPQSPPAVEKSAAGKAAFQPPYFYTSKEVKRSDVDGLYRTSFTRVVGLYVTPVGWYSVFNLGNGLCEWNTRGEIKSCEMMRMACQINGWTDDRHNMKRSSIIVARKPDVAVRIMRVTDEARAGVHFDETGKSRKYIRFDETYHNSYFVLANNDGARMLRILASPDFEEHIRMAALPDSIRLDTSESSVIADGKNEQGEYFYLFFDSELRRLRGFRDSMAGLGTPLTKCMVACFAWQEPIVREYFGPEIKIKTWDMGVIEGALGIHSD